MAQKKTYVHLAAHAYAASLTALISLLFAASPARADYAPQCGDVLEITVSGAPALNRRFTVNGDGRIVYPMLGEVEVADHPLAELKRHLQDMLASLNVVQHPDVIISVAEYGPIYVSGDVLRPGQFRYQPDMTVGNAIALAGGFDLNQSEPRVTASQRSEARAELGEAAIEYARQQVRVARIKAELAGGQQVEPEVTDAAVDPTLRAQMIGIENAELLANRDADNRERTHLEQMVADVRGELAALEAVNQRQQQTYDLQAQSAARARDLVAKGIGTMIRTEDADRAAASAQAQLLEGQVRAAQARKELQERTRDLETFDERRRTKLLEALTDSLAGAAKARYRIDSARDRLTGVGADRPHQSDVVTSARIRRIVSGQTVLIAAMDDTKLQTGDSVEIIADMAPPRRSTASK